MTVSLAKAGQWEKSHNSWPGWHLYDEVTCLLLPHRGAIIDLRRRHCIPCRVSTGSGEPVALSGTTPVFVRRCWVGGDWELARTLTCRSQEHNLEAAVKAANSRWDWEVPAALDMVGSHAGEFHAV